MESSQARACWSCCVVVVAELLVRLKKRREARPSVFFAFTVWCRDVRKVRPLPCHPVEGCGGCPVGALGSTSDGRCSSAGVHLPVFICRCSSAGVYLPVFICRCEGGGAGRSDPAATAGAHQVCCRGALPRCAAWLPARARSCSSGTQGRTQRELPSPWLGRCRKARGSLLPGVLKKYGLPSSSRSTHVACTGRRKQRRTEEAFVFA